MLCAIWYHLFNSKNLKNIHGEVTVLVKLQASSSNFKKKIPRIFEGRKEGENHVYLSDVWRKYFYDARITLKS